MYFSETRPREHASKARSDWQHEQSQNRRWLDAQMQLPDHPINKQERQELHKWFRYESLATQRAPPASLDGSRLSASSQTHIDRLTAEREEARIQKARSTGQEMSEVKFVEDWWVSEAEKRKREQRAEELANSAQAKTRRQRDYERRRQFLKGKCKDVQGAGGSWVATAEGAQVGTGMQGVRVEEMEVEGGSEGVEEDNSTGWEECNDSEAEEEYADVDEDMIVPVWDSLRG